LTFENHEKLESYLSSISTKNCDVHDFSILKKPEYNQLIEDVETSEALLASEIESEIDLDTNDVESIFASEDICAVPPFRQSANTVIPRVIGDKLVLSTEEQKLVPVWYATTRAASFLVDKIVGYGDEGGQEPRFGMARVPVAVKRNVTSPLNKKRPWWYWPFGGKKNSISISPMVSEQFYASLETNASALSGESASKQVLLFIHGYRVGFGDAVKRAAQLALDLKIFGPVLCFSWASKAKLFSYAHDSRAAGFSVPALRNVLERIGSFENEPLSVNIVAHSMGNRPLLRVLSEFWRHGSSVRISNIFFAAPDEDTRVFKLETCGLESIVDGQITLYASVYDRALAFSSGVYGSSRAGLLPPPALVPGIKTIDVSANDHTFVGHSAFCESRVVIEDMMKVIHHGATEFDSRSIEKVEMENGAHYWRLS
jgi:esterase/lipase superfamily enzyme